MTKLDEVPEGKMNRIEKEISLSFALKVFKRHLHIIIITPVVFGALAFMYSAYFASKEWEANAIIQVGKVGITEVEARPAEPTPTVIARIQHPSFIKSVTERLALSPSKFKSESELFSKSLKVAAVADNGLIAVKLKSHSPEMAESLAKEIIEALREIHEKLMKANKESIKQKIQIASENIRTLTAEIGILNKQLKGHDWSSYDAVLAATILNEKNTKLINMIQSKQTLEQVLQNPAVTYPTQLIGGVSISDGPIFPKTKQIVFLAILVGLLLGIIAVLVRAAFESQEQS